MSSKPDSKPRPPIDTSNPHAVVMWIKEQQAAGVLRKCANLDIAKFTLTAETNSTYDYFIPECLKQSFIWSVGFRSNEDRVEMLRILYDEDIIACPKDCINYRSERMARWLWPVKWVYRRSKLTLILIFRWFHRLAWQTQVALITLVALILVLTLEPKWVPRIVELIKAARGK